MLDSRRGAHARTKGSSLNRKYSGLIRLQNVVELIIFSLDGQWFFVIYESSVIKSLVILRTILHRGDGRWIGIRMFSWCSRTGALMELPTTDSFVGMLLQVVPRGPAWSKGGPHNSTVLHGVRRTRIEHRLVLEPAVFRLHAGGCIRHGDHPAFPVSVEFAFQEQRREHYTNKNDTDT